MLDRSGNADGYIEIGSDRLAGLADLQIVGRIARVHRRARRADRGVEAVRHRLDEFAEILGAAERRGRPKR